MPLHPASIAVVAAAALAVSGCGKRDDDTCDDTDVAVASPAIGQGFAGYGAAFGDLGDAFGRVSCDPGTYDLLFVAADVAPADDNAASALLSSDAERHTVNTGDDGYELAVDAGPWLVCEGFRVCYLVIVEADAVTSVHVRSSADLPSVYALNADGSDALGRGYDVVFAVDDDV